jgi:hypothetical protein
MALSARIWRRLRSHPRFHKRKPFRIGVSVKDVRYVHVHKRLLRESFSSPLRSHPLSCDRSRATVASEKTLKVLCATVLFTFPVNDTSSRFGDFSRPSAQCAWNRPVREAFVKDEQARSILVALLDLETVYLQHSPHETTVGIGAHCISSTRADGWIDLSTGTGLARVRCGYN